MLKSTGRRLIKEERARERDEALLRMFNEASEDLKPEDREERNTLLGTFVAND